MEEQTKYCKGCKQTLPRTDFHRNGITVHPVCKTCRQKERSAQNNPRKEGNKVCPKCDIDHPTTEFDSDKSQPDGLQSYCKKCKHEIRLKYLSTYDGFIKHLFKDLRSNAKKRKITVNITIEDIHQLYITQNKKCAFTGIIMRHESADRQTGDQHILNKWNISVDRIDSSKGYTKDNIQLVCAIVNRLKTSLSDTEFILLCGAITQRNFNRINNLIISNIDDSEIDLQHTINKSIITDLFTDQAESQSENIKLATKEQRYICSFDGYIKKIYLNTKHNLKKRSKKLAYTITEEDIKKMYIKQQGKCIISGIKMTYIGYQNATNDQLINNWNISVDRIDSTKGYTPTNIQLVCTIVNRMKTDLTTDELLIVCDNINRKNFSKINKELIKIIKQEKQVISQ